MPATESGNIRDQAAELRWRCRRSKYLAPYADLDGRDAIKLFFPPPEQVNAQVAMPEERWRREWKDGWDAS